MVNTKIDCVTSLPKGISRRIFSFRQEDLDRNDVWSTISSRKRFNPFFEKFSFQRYKTHHTNKPSKVRKIAKYAATQALIEDIAVEKVQKANVIKKAKHVVTQGLMEDMAMKIHEVNKAHMPRMRNPLGKLMMIESQTQIDTIGDLVERKWSKQETTPPKKRTLERSVVDEVDGIIFTGSITMSTHDASDRVITDNENTYNVIT